MNGTGIPEVPFDVGESYAGLLPISDDPNETRKLFFWLVHPTVNMTGRCLITQVLPINTRQDSGRGRYLVSFCILLSKQNSDKSTGSMVDQDAAHSAAS